MLRRLTEYLVHLNKLPFQLTFYLMRGLVETFPIKRIIDRLPFRVRHILRTTQFYQKNLDRTDHDDDEFIKAGVGVVVEDEVEDGDGG